MTPPQSLTHENLRGAVRPTPLAALLMSAVTAAASVFPGGAHADLWVLAGQSNMQGAGVIAKTYAPNPRVMVYDLGGEWLPAVPPTHRLLNSPAPVFKQLLFKSDPTLTEQNWPQRVADFRLKPWGGVGPDLSFADGLVAATGRNIGLIPCAFGGTSMAQWSPANRDQGGASLYGHMMDRIRAVGGKIKGVLWYQGESEGGSAETAAAFTPTFLNLVDSIRRDTGIPELPFIYVQISRYELENNNLAANWEVVREQQRLAAGQRKNLWVVPAIDLPLDDLIHIGTPGQERLGRRLAEVALTHVYGLEGRGRPLDLVSCAVLPSTEVLHHSLRVKFSGVTGRLQAAGRPTGFELRSDDPNRDGPMVYKVEFDPTDPAALIVWYTKAIKAPVRLYYGAGINPYVNLTDNLDMAVPAFGPIVIAPAP